MKKSHHHTPALEEITHKFQEDTVFSKLDTRDGYWSVVLRVESSYLPPFSPFGRLKFLLVFPLVSQHIFQQMYFILEKCPGEDGIGVSIGITLHGPTEEEHDSNLHNLKLVARKHELGILDKCVIKETFNIEFLRG